MTFRDEQLLDASEPGIGIKPHARKAGLRQIIAAAKYSIDGLRLAAQSETAFKQELIAFIFLAPLALWVGESAVERVLLVGSLVLVMIVELLNTAVEAVVDRVSADFHELSKQAKDLGSAAVLLSISLAFITGYCCWSERRMNNFFRVCTIGRYQYQNGVDRSLGINGFDWPAPTFATKSPINQSRWQPEPEACHPPFLRHNP